jgi:hypothetical protein
MFYLTWLVLDIILAGGGLSNMVCVRYYHELVGVYPTMAVSDGWMLDGCLSLGPGTPGLILI